LRTPSRSILRIGSVSELAVRDPALEEAMTYYRYGSRRIPAVNGGDRSLEKV
jgi:hypothetical protein